MKANKSWFKLKRYPHIGLPISPNQRNDIEKFIHNKIKISHYAFLPLIRRNIEHSNINFAQTVNLERKPKYVILVMLHILIH